MVNDSLPISEVITQELYLGSEKFWCLLQQPFLHPFRFWHPFSIDLNIKSNNNAKCKFTFSSIFCTMAHKMSRCHVSGIGCMQWWKSFRNWIRCSSERTSSVPRFTASSRLIDYHFSIWIKLFHKFLPNLQKIWWSKIQFFFISNLNLVFYWNFCTVFKIQTRLPHKSWNKLIKS